MIKKSILELLRTTEHPCNLLGTGRTADVYKFSDEALKSWVLRIRHDEGPSLDFLNSSTCLIPVQNNFYGKNFGQPVLEAYGVSINLLKGNDSLSMLYNKKIHSGASEITAYDEIIKLITKSGSESFDNLAFENNYLTKINKGIDHIGDNIVIDLSGKLGFIDTDRKPENNTKPNTYDMLVNFDIPEKCPSKDLLALHNICTEIDKSFSKTYNIELPKSMQKQDIGDLNLNQPVSRLIEHLKIIELSYSLELFK